MGIKKLLVPAWISQHTLTGANLQIKVPSALFHGVTVGLRWPKPWQTWLWDKEGIVLHGGKRAQDAPLHVQRYCCPSSAHSDGNGPSNSLAVTIQRSLLQRVTAHNRPPLTWLSRVWGGHVYGDESTFQTAVKEAASGLQCQVLPFLTPTRQSVPPPPPLPEKSWIYYFVMSYVQNYISQDKL